MQEGYAALRRGAAWMDLKARGRILARGRDRARLLHNVTTNEVKKMAPGEGCYAFLLSPQGRIQADLLLFCFEDRFLIGVEPELREKAVRHIRRYIIADQVELEDISPRTAEIGIEGPGAAAALAALGAPAPDRDYSHLAWNDSTIARASLTGQPGFRIFCPEDAAGDLIRALESAGATPATAEDARVVRIENGKPRYGDDIRDTTLPQETRQMHAVSFTKGCYIGQEIVERIRARGHVNRALERIELEGADPPPAGTVIEAGGKQAEITSSAYSPDAGKVVALAYVRE
ncbi:MAG: folate-binding protein [Bryobacteraceae bacterium]|jgi:aminomethyltransferase